MMTINEARQNLRLAQARKDRAELQLHLRLGSPSAWKEDHDAWRARYKAARNLEQAIDRGDALA